MYATTQKFPLDIATLKKGDTITQEQMQEIFGLEPDTKDFRLAVLNLKHFIEYQLAIKDYWVTVKEDSGNLCILTDSESAAYNNRRFRNSINAAMRSYQRQLKTVEVKNLSSAERQAHYNNLAVNGAVVQSISSSVKSMRVEGTKRKVPGLTAV